MAKVLITGSSGFIGGHLAEHLLRQGTSVRCLVRRPTSVSHLQTLGAEIIEGDVSKPETVERAVDGVDVVYHLAGLTAALRSDDLWRVNRDGTRNVAHACANQSKPPVHVVVSSIAAAGPTEAGNVRLANETPNPVSLYGRSKLDGELAAIAFADQVPTTIVRPGIVFGPRNREMLPMFNTIERLRVHPQASRHSPQMSLIHVDDLVEMIVRAAQRGVRVAKSEIAAGRGYYFACASHFPTYAELGQMLARALGHDRVVVLQMAGPVPWVIAGLNQAMARLRGVPDTFNIDKIREAKVQSWACSTAETEQDLGLSMAYPLEQQLAETVAWYREQGWLRSPVAEPARTTESAWRLNAATWLPFGPRRQAGSSSR